MTTDERILKLVQATLDRAAVFQEMGNTDEALSEYKNAYDLLPSLAAEPYAQALYQLGQEKEKSGDSEEALRDFSAALEVAPEGQLKAEILHRKTTLENPPPAHPAVCPSCGKEMQPHWKICPLCGTKLSEPPSFVPKLLEPEPFRPKIEPQVQKKSWRKSVLWIIGGIVLLLVFITLGIIDRVATISATETASMIAYATSASHTQEASVRLTDAYATSALQTQEASVRLTNAYATSASQTQEASVRLTDAYATSAAQTQEASVRRTDAYATSAAQTQEAPIRFTEAAATRQIIEITLHARSELNEVVTNVCNGKGDARAAQYEKNRSFHPLIIYPFFSYTYHDQRFVDAKPSSLNELQLVACIADGEEKQIKSTGYTQSGFGTPDYFCVEKVKLISITVRSAKTGKILAKFDVQGSKPSPCGKKETFIGDRTTKEYVGAEVSPTQIWEAIKNFVNLESKK